jgi:GAF domain-containing protein
MQLDNRMSETLNRDLLKILDAVIAVDGAGRGNLQLLNRELGALEIFVQRGFDQSYLDLFRLVRADEPSVCGRALRLKKRIMISDIASDRYYAPYLSISIQANIRAVQSTPILGSDGEVIGMLSTHYSKVHSLSRATEKELDKRALEARIAIEEHQPLRRVRRDRI